MSTLFDEMWPAFFAEVSEQLDELEVLLSSGVAADFDVGQAFRLFHTIKSSCAMMDFKEMEQLAHAAEDILDLVRDGKAQFTEQTCDLMVAVAERLKLQLSEADRTRKPPAGDSGLLAQARDMLVSLGGDLPAVHSEESPVAPEETPASPAIEIDPVFAEFAAALDVLMPPLASWVVTGKGRTPAELNKIATACDMAGFPGLYGIASQLGQSKDNVRLQLMADFVLRLEGLRRRSGLDCGVDKLALVIRPGLVPHIQEGAMHVLETPGLELGQVSDEGAQVLLDRTRTLGAQVRLAAFPSLAFLLRFVEQILREVSRANLRLPAELAELMMSAYSLCLEIEPEQGEDADFAEICGRVLTTLQEIARHSDSEDESPDARDTLMSEFDVPYSLLSTLHGGCLPRMLEFCRKQVPLLDIEVDMDGPDQVRDSFISIINAHGEILSNRTVFASDRPGDLHAETTRLSIIAACTGSLQEMVPKLRGYHSEHFHLSVQPVLYRGGPEIDLDMPDDLNVREIKEAPVQPEVSVSDVAQQDKPESAGNVDTLRVSSDRLDQFVTRIGELALLRNQMDHHLRGEQAEMLMGKLHDFAQTLAGGQELSLEERHGLIACLDDISSHFDRLGQADSQMQQSLGLLQSSALDLRVVPVDTIFRRVPVLLRRLARQLGKDVNLVMEGKETRIDKSMVDVLSEPLTHMVRNALDHGIEPPDERRAKGKPETAQLILRASQRGGALVIELVDDGRGLDEKRICARAVERGLVSAEDADSLSKERIHGLIFEPGFSTAGAITETSGRGVGMDIVRTRVEQLGGEISIQSTPGEGCRIALHLPLSAAIQGIVLFSSEREVYGVAERSITEAIEVRASALQCIQGQMAVTHRDHALPVYTLAHLFGMDDMFALNHQTVLQVLLVSDGRRQIGLIVDQIHSRQEIFVRDCHPDIAALPGVSGASVLGNGEPVLILEASGLIDLAATRAQDLAALLEAS